MLEKLREIIVNYVEADPEAIVPESRFVEDLGFTSFDFMSMLGEIEEAFDLEVERREAAGLRTVGEAMEYLSRISD